MNALLKTLHAFETYINGGSSKTLKLKFNQYYDHNHKGLKKDFYKTTIYFNPLIKEQIESILKNLNIPKHKWEAYPADLTIYDFFLKLAQKGHPQISYFIDTIDHKTRLTKFELGMRIGMLVPFFAIFLSIPAVQMGVEIIREFLTTISVPVFGLFFSCCATSYRFYMTTTNKKQSEFNRWRDNFFLLATVPLNIFAYGLLLFGSSILSPLIGALFVSVSGIRVLKEIFCLIQEVIIYKTKEYNTDNDWIIVNKAYIRRKFDYQKRLIAVAINIVAALLLFGIMTIGCFVPGGLVVTIATISAMAAIYLIQITCLKLNEMWLRNRLQKQLRALDEHYEKYKIQEDADLEQEESNEIELDEEFSFNFNPQNIFAAGNEENLSKDKKFSSPAMPPKVAHNESSKQKAASSLRFFSQHKNSQNSLGNFSQLQP